METPPNPPFVFQQFEQKEKKKAERHNTIKLIIGCVVILAGIGAIVSGSTITSICLIFCGVLLIPQIISWIERKLKFSFKILKYFLIVGFFVCAALADDNIVDNKKTEKPAINNDSISRIATRPNYNHEILKQETIASGQINYWILVNNIDLSEKNIKRIAFELRDKLCSGTCAISLYDDKKAFLLDEEFEKQNTQLGQMLSEGKVSKEQYRATLKKYEKKFYVEVADHLIGFLSHLDSDNFDYYPYRDSRYKELGGKNEATAYHR